MAKKTEAAVNSSLKGASNNRRKKSERRDELFGTREDGQAVDELSAFLPQITCVAERKLMLAVLEDAITSFQRRVLRQLTKTDDHDNVWAWIESTDDTGPFSFVNICLQLNMDPDYIREGLRNWARRASQKSPGKVVKIRKVAGNRMKVLPKRPSKKRVKRIENTKEKG